MIHKLTVNLYF